MQKVSQYSPHSFRFGPNFTWLSCLRIQLFHHDEIAGLADLTGLTRGPNSGLLGVPRIREGDEKILQFYRVT
jgi:hypothetical protein